MQKAIAERYPRTYQLEDRAKITFSLMSSADQQALAKFIAELPNRDLSYLQIDLSQTEVQDRWLSNIKQGTSICICAYDPKGMVGYASVQLDKAKRAGEIRVNISQGYRSRGLGRGLIDEVMFVSRQIELQTVTARMLSDQHGAKAAFRRLGFQNERLLENHVPDSPGSKDLLVMAATLQ